MLEQNLSKLGFSPSEIKVYLYLFKTGSNYANKISSETKINRTNVYEALDRLVAKGVVSFITKNKVKWFEAKNPDSVFTLIKEKEEELKVTRDDLLKDINSLKVSPDKNSLEANVFVGRKGLRMLFEGILVVRKPVSFMASQWQFKEYFGPYYDLWHKQRAMKGIKQRTIFPISFKGKVNKKELLEFKFVDNNFTSPTSTVIYGDNCLFIQWSKEPIAIKINNKEIARSHLNYFNMLWGS